MILFLTNDNIIEGTIYHGVEVQRARAPATTLSVVIVCINARIGVLFRQSDLEMYRDVTQHSREAFRPVECQQPAVVRAVQG